MQQAGCGGQTLEDVTIVTSVLGTHRNDERATVKTLCFVHFVSALCHFTGLSSTKKTMR